MKQATKNGSQKLSSGELSREEIDKLLYKQAYGRLACTDGDQPYIVPVTYAYDGKYIYGQTNEGAKLNILRKNPKICFEVDLMTGMRDWQGVVIQGQFEELKAAAAEKAREILYNKVFPLLTNNMIHPFEHEVTTEIDDSTRIRTTMYRVVINKISGRYQKQ